VEPGGRLLIGGAFRHVDGIARPGIARLFGEDGVPRPVLNLVPGGVFQVSFPTISTPNYLLEFTDALDEPWTELTSVIGDGDWKTLTDNRPEAQHRFYRLRVE
jgi:hypothetical protein